MIKFRTKTEFPILDKRGKTIGNYIIRLIVNNINADINGAIATGFYYYCDENNNEISLDAFGTPFPWSLVDVAENQLPPLESTTSLKSNIFQRVAQFGLIQQMIESGDNYGTVGSDWEMDTEYNQRMRASKK